MSETIWIVLIVAVTVIVILWLFRGSLRRFFLKANRDGVEAELETHSSEQNPTIQTNDAPKSQPSVNISGNKQVGKKNKISVERPDVNITDNTQAGENQTIEVKSDKKKK